MRWDGKSILFWTGIMDLVNVLKTVFVKGVIETI